MKKEIKKRVNKALPTITKIAEVLESLLIFIFFYAFNEWFFEALKVEFDNKKLVISTFLNYSIYLLLKSKMFANSFFQEKTRKKRVKKTVIKQIFQVNDLISGLSSSMYILLNFEIMNALMLSCCVIPLFIYSTVKKVKKIR